MADLGKSKHTAQHSMPPSLCSNLSEPVCCLSIVPQPNPPPPPQPCTPPPADSFGFFGFGSPSSLVMATFCCCCCGPPDPAVSAADDTLRSAAVWTTPPPPPVKTAGADDCVAVEPSPSDMSATTEKKQQPLGRSNGDDNDTRRSCFRVETPSERRKSPKFARSTSRRAVS